MTYRGLTALMGASVVTAICAVSAQAQSAPAAPRYVPGEVLVSFRAQSLANPSGSMPSAESVRTAQNLTLQRVNTLMARAEVEETLQNGEIARIHVPQDTSVEKAIELLRQDPRVAFAQPNYIYTTDSTPNDPYVTNGTSWAVQNKGQNSGLAGADIHAVEAWNVTTGSSDVVVAVIDSGVDYNHSDLAPNIFKNTKEIPGNGIDDDGDGYVDDVNGWNAITNNGNPMDDNGHGTHCAGIIGAVGNNGVGVTGVAWNVKILPLKFLDSTGSGNTVNAIKCINYMNALKAQGVNIVAANNSWGGGGTDLLLKQAIDRAGNLGILFVAAAGNAGKNIDVSPEYPASFPSTNLIAVAATDRKDTLASFSNYGLTTVALAAPGASIISTVRNNGYATMSGTSMATPFVTGAAVLVKAANPTLTAAQIKQILLDSGDPIAAVAGKTITGKRLNVARAVQQAKPQASPFAMTLASDKPAYAAAADPATVRAVVTTTDATGKVVAAKNTAVTLCITGPNGVCFFNGALTTNFSGAVSTRQALDKLGAGTYTATATVATTGAPVTVQTITFARQ